MINEKYQTVYDQLARGIAYAHGAENTIGMAESLTDDRFDATSEVYSYVRNIIYALSHVMEFAKSEIERWDDDDEESEDEK